MSTGRTSGELELLQVDHSVIKYLIQITGDGFTWRFCTGQNGVAHSSNYYEPRAMAISIVRQADPARAPVTIDIDNRDDISEDCTDGLTGAEIDIYMMTRSGGAWQSAMLIGSGEITRGAIDDDITISAGPKNRGVNKSGLYKMSRTCRYPFKGTLCAYAGTDTTCRRTLEDCVSKTNRNRFGGYIWALDAGESIMTEGPPVVVEGHWESLNGFVNEEEEDYDQVRVRPGGSGQQAPNGGPGRRA